MDPQKYKIDTNTLALCVLLICVACFVNTIAVGPFFLGKAESIAQKVASDETQRTMNALTDALTQSINNQNRILLHIDERFDRVESILSKEKDK